MSSVLVCCPGCGEVTANVCQVTLRLAEGDAVAATLECPMCLRRISVSVDDNARRLLQRVGCEVEPRRLSSASGDVDVRTGAITEAEIERFCADLDRVRLG